MIQLPDCSSTQKTPGQICICTDMRAKNQAIKRTNHSTQTFTEIIHELKGAKIFSKIDRNQGYNQWELVEGSCEIITFKSHVDSSLESKVVFFLVFFFLLPQNNVTYVYNNTNCKN